MAMDISFWEGKTALVTGATSDIGHALCRRLLQYKIKLVITGRNEELLRQREADLLAEGGEVYSLVGNLENEFFLRRLVDYTVDCCQGLDILINSAGIGHNSPIDNVTTELFDAIMRVNVRAPYFLAQNALPYLRVSDAATVINICSVTAHMGYVNQSAYTISQHALLGASKALSTENFDQNIRVHVISPGAVDTEMIKMVRPDLDPSELIHPEDIADVMSFYLDHRHSAFIIDETRMHRTNKRPFM